MPCAIPLFLTLLAANPCATWDHVQASFAEARKRVWWSHDTLDRYYGWQDTWTQYSDPKMEELEGWTLIEIDGVSFPHNGSELAGLIDASDKTIRWAKNSPLWPLAHEFVHWIHLNHPIPYGTFWQYTGHGGLYGVGSLDAFTFSLWQQMCGVFYYPFCDIPDGHQYSPQWLFENKLEQVGANSWCGVAGVSAGGADE
jgi:hypothetical protein